MKKELEISNIIIEYKDDEKAKEKFIAYVVDYLLDNGLFEKDGDDK